MDLVVRGANTLEGADVIDKRLLVYSFSIADTLVEAFKGNAFNASTKTINLTSATESAVAYVKNNDTRPLVISRIGYLFGSSTGGSGDLNMRVVKRPTGGTIIDNAVSMPVISNRNTGSSDSFDVDLYKGVEGDTLVGGTEVFPTLLTGPKDYVIPADLVLDKGEDAVIAVTPQSGNTSMNLMVFLNCYFFELKNQIVL